MENAQKHVFKKEICMGIFGLELYPESLEGKASVRVMYTYGNPEEKINFVSEELGEIISCMTGIPIKERKE